MYRLIKTKTKQTSKQTKTINFLSFFREIVMQDLFVQIVSAFAKLVLFESQMKYHCSVTCHCVVIGGCLLLLTLASQSMSRMMPSFSFRSLRGSVLEKSCNCLFVHANYATYETAQSKQLLKGMKIKLLEFC